MRSLSRNSRNHGTIAEAGAISQLVVLLQVGTATAKQNAAAVLQKLADNNDDNRASIARAGAISPLAARCPSPDRLCHGETERSALWNLAKKTDNNRASIARAGAIPRLVVLLQDARTALRHDESLCCGSAVFIISPTTTTTRS